MTEDREIEERLRRYRPAGPSAELREKSMRGVRLQPDRGGAWWQLAAAALLFATALLLQSATARIDRRIVLVTAPTYDADEKHLDDLVREFGGDPSAHILAAAILIRERDSGRADFPAMEIQQ